MRAVLLFLALQVVLVVSASAETNMTREERIKEHQRKIDQVIQENRRKQAEQNAYAPGPPPTLPEQSQESADDYRWRDGTLWPGESVTFREVTASWRFDADKQTSSGLLEIRGRHTPPWSIPVPFARANDRVFAYVDDVVFSFSENRESSGVVKSLPYRRMAQASKQEFSGAKEGRDLFISNACPLHLEQWKLTVSPVPVEYPDGSKYHNLTVANEDDGTSFVTPINRRLSREFGRFTMQGTDMFDERTLTAMLEVAAKEDLAPRGRDTYISDFQFPEGENLGQFFERLGKEYGFAVEWEPDPTYPEAVEYTKRLSADPQAKRPGGLLRQILASDFQRNDEKGLLLKWKDRTHLTIRPWNYRVVDLRKATVEAALEMDALFQKSYTAQTKVYPVGTMKADTAQALIAPYLKTFVLTLGSPKDSVVVERGKWHIIASTSDKGVVDSATTKTREFAVVDSAANSIIVTAVPSTHAEIEKVLGKLQTLVRSESTTPTAKSYRVEVVLLKGRKPGASASRTEEDTTTGPVTRQVTMNSTVSYGDLTLRVEKIIGPATGVDTRLLEVAVSARTETTVDNTVQVHENNFLISQDAPAEVDGYIVKVRDARKFEQEDLNRCTLEISRIPKAKGNLATEESAGLSDADLAAKYGISDEDLKLFGLGNLSELGKGVVTILGEPGEGGKARVSLTEAYAAELQFQDVRAPYVIIRGRLSGIQPSDRTLLENTLYLEHDKPTLLGLTNLKEALMLIVRLHDKP